MEVDLGPGHIVLDGNPAPLPKRGQSPQFSAHFYCGQTAGWGGTSQFSAHVYCGQTAAWIQMPLDTEVGLGLRDIGGVT